MATRWVLESDYLVITSLLYTYMSSIHILSLYQSKASKILKLTLDITVVVVHPTGGTTDVVHPTGGTAYVMHPTGGTACVMYPTAALHLCWCF